MRDSTVSDQRRNELLSLRSRVEDLLSELRRLPLGSKGKPAAKYARAYDALVNDIRQQTGDVRVTRLLPEPFGFLATHEEARTVFLISIPIVVVGVAVGVAIVTRPDISVLLVFVIVFVVALRFLSAPFRRSIARQGVPTIKNTTERTSKLAQYLDSYIAISYPSDDVRPDTPVGEQMDTNPKEQPVIERRSLEAVAPTDIQCRHLETQRQELNKQYEQLTERIAALDTDLALELDSERKLVLKERREQEVTEREAIIGQLREIERQLNGSNEVSST